MTYVIYVERELQILTIRLGIVQKNARKEILDVTQCLSIRNFPKEELRHYNFQTLFTLIER